ncbi:conserved hypothetical protein [Theileria equi strain WA]|uniref:Signal peptide containing protein n=1 Tax=Theileria equi strain WA TaxID=1537102 RepID=L1LDZ0_THEEQ|nr:conserved hypothetical protein [Theileria equi strain WA]EKX73465.1 conserved hypothetical protein [Theileria equi strain WA]|eukprot:XP_004832917.1 conserved hypothetical protein [Theileria equi strain WA]
MKVFGVITVYIFFTWNVLQVAGSGDHDLISGYRSSGKTIKYTEYDLYPYQNMNIWCPYNMYASNETIVPLNKGGYYVKNSLLESDEKNLKQEREVKSIKDTLPEIKIIKTQDKYALYYSAPIKGSDVVKMHFDCIFASKDAEPMILSKIQVNVMPKLEYIIGKTEHFILDSFHIPRGKDLSYTKPARPGMETITECKDSDLTIHYGQSILNEEPKAKTYINPLTKVEYPDITDHVSRYQVTNRMHKIDLKNGNVVNERLNTQIRCSGGDYMLSYKAFYSPGSPGLRMNQSSSKKLDRLGESVDVIQIDSRTNSSVLVDVPTNKNIIYPNDCLNKVYLGNQVVKISDIVGDPKLTRITDSLKILNLSTSSSYRKVTVSCYTKVPQDYGHKTTWMDITVSPLCNFYDPESLDSDKKTCTLFSSGTVQSLVARPLEHFGYDKTLEFDEKLFERADDPEGTCKDCYYKPIDTEDGDMSVSINFGHDRNVTIKDGTIRFNPVYMLKKVDAEKSEGILNPSQMIRMYLHNEETEIGNDGKVIVKDKVDESGKSIFYMVQADGRSSIKISCKDFFEDSGSSQPTLFPNGKNVVYKNVSDGFMDPRTIETVQFGEEFAARGISILKKPETDVDLEIVLDQDKMIQSDHVKPLYFICSRDVKGDWKNSGKPYAVIAVDPGYRSQKLPGCSIKKGIFVDKDGKDSGRRCGYAIDDVTSVGFHCPSYVPEHFLEGDQGMYKADGNKATENPYQLLIRCYDRSTVVQKIFRPKTDLELFPKPKFAGELRSLWVFNKDTFAEKDVKEVLCICYDKTGMALSSIKVWNNTEKVEPEPEQGPQSAEEEASKK